MKILQIIYSLCSGGAERFVVDLSNELAEQGNDVTLCVLRDDKKDNNGFYVNEISNNVNYINLAIPVGFRISNTIVFYKLINRIKPDIVHCHQNLVNYVFPLSIIFRKIKFFNTIHTYPPKDISNSIEYWVRRFFYQSQILKVITISNETSKSFIEYYKTDRYTEIYNGSKMPLPSNEFQKVKAHINNLKPETNLIFLHVARCNFVKNQKLLITVFNRLISEGKSVSLLIIGNGYDSPLGDELKAMANDKIIFLEQKHNVADFYLNADAFCLSSIYEGMPITLIEAMACGCTPICTPVGGINDTIENGVTGFLSKSTSEEDYYQAINAFIKQRNRINKEELINYHKKHFSIEECAKKHIHLYKM